MIVRGVGSLPQLGDEIRPDTAADSDCWIGKPAGDKSVAVELRLAIEPEAHPPRRCNHLFVEPEQRSSTLKSTGQDKRQNFDDSSLSPSLS